MPEHGDKQQTLASRRLAFKAAVKKAEIDKSRGVLRSKNETFTITITDDNWEPEDGDIMDAIVDSLEYLWYPLHSLKKKMNTSLVPGPSGPRVPLIGLA